MVHYTRSKFVPKNYNPLHVAYLAGIIDGEGCIHIGYYFNKSVNRSTYHTSIEVTSTDMPLIEWLETNFGGKSSIYTFKQTPKNSRKKVFRWKITGDALTYICRLILPYIIIKKPQIEIMIKMRETFYDQHEPKKGQQGMQSISQELINYRHSLISQLRALHCRKGSPKSLTIPCALSSSQ